MRLRNIPRAEEVIASSNFVVHDPEQHRGAWLLLYENPNPLHLEIGTGKGRFLLEMARINPEINYLGIEKYSSVLLRGVERQNELALPNLRFVRGEAEILTEYFDPGEVDRIYLNFSDPWPKKRNAKRRLPSREFLRRYDRILSEYGTIEFKTDNRELFDFAVEEVSFSSFEICAITYDLHHDPDLNKNNVMTEYEERFSQKGNLICKYILHRKIISSDA